MGRLHWSETTSLRSDVRTTCAAYTPEYGLKTSTCQGCSRRKNPTLATLCTRGSRHRGGVFNEELSATKRTAAVMATAISAGPCESQLCIHGRAEGAGGEDANRHLGRHVLHDFLLSQGYEDRVWNGAQVKDFFTFRSDGQSGHASVSSAFSPASRTPSAIITMPETIPTTFAAFGRLVSTAAAP